MGFPPALLYMLLMLAAAAAAVGAGLPLRPAPEGTSWWKVVAERDRTLLIVAVSVSFLAVLALIAGMPPGVGAVLLLSLPAAAWTGFDRWDRTNGDHSPLTTLLACTRRHAAHATDDPQATQALGDALAALPRKQRKQLVADLKAIADPNGQRHLICKLLAAEALRTASRGGVVIWASSGKRAQERRDALLALATSHPATLRRVLR